jgi:transcriptional regulator with XRE-family HTH domain
VGNENVESLTSYINRICVEHSTFVSHFFNHFVFSEYKNEKFIKTALVNIDGHINYFYSSKFNNNSDIYKLLVRILRDISLRTDLYLLTPYYLNNYVSPNPNCYKMKKYWCSLCYEDMKKRNVPIYDKLFWSLQVVDSCVVHKCYLSNKCPFCKKEQDYLTKKGFYGYCIRCYKWLGEEKVPKISDAHFVWQKWVYQNIADIMKGDPNSYPTTEQYLYKLRNLLAMITKKETGITLNDLAYSMEFSGNILSLWKNTSSPPTLSRVLKLLFYLNIPFKTLLFHSSEIQIDINPLLIKKRDQKENVVKKYPTLSELKKIINEIILNNPQPPKSLTEIAKSLGYVSSKGISKKFKKEAEIIKERYRKYNAKTKEIKIKTALIKIINENRNPPLSFGQVLKEIGIKKSILYETMFKDEVRIIIQRHQNYKREIKLAKIEIKKDKITQCFIDFHKIGRIPNTKEIASFIGDDFFSMNAEVYQHYVNLRDNIQKE